MSVRTYNPSVRVGNWNEDIQLEEDTLKDFLQKREKGELLYQKRTKLEEKVFKPVDLSISRDGYVHYGDKVNIRCPAAKDQTKYFTNVDPRKDSQLVVVPHISKIMYSQKFESPCSVAGAKDLSANLRSTFVIKSLEGGMDGKALRYGDKFHISTLGEEGGDLLLHSDRLSLHTSPNRSRHQEVKLVSEPSAMTQWQILHFNPRLRMEYESTPVPANEKVIINHAVTNQDLAVEQKFCNRTPFGTSEYEITSHTYLDTHKAEEDMNHWVLVMGAPGESVYPEIEPNSTQASSATGSS